jgi:hypothetical protein
MVTRVLLERTPVVTGKRGGRDRRHGHGSRDRGGRRIRAQECDSHAAGSRRCAERDGAGGGSALRRHCRQQQ